ncbi:hypothetical protein [Frateuria sp. STR12]|uniref:hypothetical protein n=1 Tax=Frateuria hangzhouensis TaxID=2995589 RepID=UPI002260B82E|nr:hypothetical protein [Frateuria sp. STR12]MCX7514653.1 hypothetical protein [Frateuria sp. STR12]
MDRPRLKTLYKAIFGYAVMCLVLGKMLQVVTVVLGFGLLIVAYLGLEWVATPLVAAYAGVQSRWSPRRALWAGIPLFVVFTVVTPVVDSGASALPMPVPWLSVFQAKKAEVLPVIEMRLAWWACVYGVAYVLGLFSRRFRPAGKAGIDTVHEAEGAKPD